MAQNPYENFDQQALIEELGKGQTPVPMPLPGQMPEPAADPAKPVQPKSAFDILRGYDYGPAGLLAAEKELSGIGAQIQKDSAGQARGRIKLANGDIVDVFDPREGRSEQDNWNTNLKGQEWAFNNLGQAGLDAGGWSFGGPSSSQGASPLIDNEALNLTGSDPDGFFEKLMAELQKQAGHSGDRAALVAELTGGR